MLHSNEKKQTAAAYNNMSQSHRCNIKQKEAIYKREYTMLSLYKSSKAGKTNYGHKIIIAVTVVESW